MWPRGVPELDASQAGQVSEASFKAMRLAENRDYQMSRNDRHRLLVPRGPMSHSVAAPLELVSSDLNNPVPFIRCCCLWG